MRWLILILAFLLSSCAKSDAPGQRKDDALIRLTESESRGLDPQIVSDLSSIRIAADLFEGLTRMSAAGEAEPGLAKNWDISGNGKSWTFHLRPDLHYSDGKPVTADVFVKALKRIRDPKSGSPHSSLFAIIDSVEAPEHRTVIINLIFPFPQLPALLAHPAMAALPFHRIDDVGDQWSTERPLSGSGPYRLDSWRLNQEMMLSANPQYHGGKPATEKLIWKPVDNIQSAMRLFLSGGVDTLTDFPANRLPWLMQNYPKAVHNSSYFGSYYYTFNTRKPPFNDARVRRALSMAVDREWIAKNMMASGNEPAWGLLPPALVSGTPARPAWADWPKSKRLAQARRLLGEAGYNIENPLRFEIRYNSSSEHRRVSVAMSTMWRAIDVEATLLNSEASLHFDSLKRADFMLARSGWIADLPAAENFLSVHRSNAGTQNYSGYANPAYDSALEAALAEAEPIKRNKKMQAAEAILVDDMPILPLYYYTVRALVRPNVTGWVDNPSNVHPSRTLAIGRP